MNPSVGQRLLEIYTDLMHGPYKLALHYITLDATAHVYEVRRYWSYGDFVCGLVRELSKGDQDFVAKIMERDDAYWKNSEHKTRRYIAERHDLLYIGSPHLTEQHSKKVGEVWVATNIGRKEALAVSNMAAAARGIKRSVWSALKP